MTRAIVIGDVHLGPGPRQADRIRALRQITDHGVSLDDRRELLAWIYVGDVFHKTSSIDDRNLFLEFVLEQQRYAPVFICRGNHDAVGDLRIYEAVGHGFGVSVIETAQVVRRRVSQPHHLQQHDLTLFVLPWPEEAALVAAGTPPADVPVRAHEALDALFLDAGRQIYEAATRGHLTAFVGHCTVVGAVASNGQPQAGLGIEIDAELLSRLPDCPKVVGHIHKGQAVAGAVYPGSICRLDYGEIEPKRFLEIVWDDDRSWTLHEHPIDVAPLYHVEGWLSREGFTYELAKGPDGSSPCQPESWRGIEVRARVKYHQAEGAVLDLSMPHVLAEFAEAARLELEPVCVPDTGLRAPEVAAAVTIADKVTAWAEAVGVVLPDDLAHALETLTTSEPEPLLARVRREAEAWLVTEQEGVGA